MTNSRPSPYLLAALALLSGGLLALCFPPFGLYPLAWVALVPLLAALGRVRRAREGAGLALLTGLVLFGALHSYLLMYGLLPTFLVALFQALPVALFGAVAGRLAAGRRPLLSAVALAGAWVLAEWLRGNLGGLSLTLGQLGYSQQPWLPVLQTAAVAGVLGISFLIVLVNAALAGALFPVGAAFARTRATAARSLALGQRRGVCCAADGATHAPTGERDLPGRWAALAVALGVAAAAGLGGAAALHRPLPPGTLSVAVAQPDVFLHTPVTVQDEINCLHEYPRYTDMLMKPYGSPEAPRPGRPQLVVWPETAFPTPLNWDPMFAEAARQTARRNRIWLLMGALDYESPPGATGVDFTQGRVFNTAWLFDDTGELVGTYSKMDLVPFGEYVPYRKQLPLLSRYPIRDFDFARGSERAPLAVRTHACGALICFEAILPRDSREMVQAGAEFLAFLTSDAWAGATPEVLIHSQTAPLRAVETGRWVVRAASTGESGIISPRGQWVASVPPWHSGTAEATISTLDGRTLYDRWGDWPLVGLALVLVLFGMGKGRRLAGGLGSESEV